MNKIDSIQADFYKFSQIMKKKMRAIFQFWMLYLIFLRIKCEKGIDKKMQNRFAL